MKKKIQVIYDRTVASRVVHSVLYEIFGAMFLFPATYFVFHTDPFELGGLLIAMTVISMGWNVAYNWLADKLFNHFNIKRNTVIRIIHTILFDVTLTCLTLPLTMYVLELNFLQGLSVEIGFILVNMVFTYLYNYTFDAIYFTFINKPRIVRVPVACC